MGRRLCSAAPQLLHWNSHNTVEAEAKARGSEALGFRVKLSKNRKTEGKARSVGCRCMGNFLSEPCVEMGIWRYLEGQEGFVRKSGPAFRTDIWPAGRSLF